MKLFSDARAHEYLTGTTFRTVTIQFSKLSFQLSDFHAFVFGHVRQSVDAITFLFDLPKRFMAHNHRIDDRVRFKRKLILMQLPKPLIGGKRNVS